MTRKTRFFAARAHLRLAQSLLFMVCFVLPLFAQKSPGSDDVAAAQNPGVTASKRIIVKLRAPLADEVETSLPLETMAISTGATKNPRILDFMRRHTAKQLKALYPGIVRQKKLRHITDRQLANEVRQRFAMRANRLQANFKPPDISRAYILEVDASESGKIAQILNRLKADSDVEYAEEDRIVSINATPNDPYFSSYGTWGQAYDDLWGVKKVDAPAAWDTNAGDGIVVAVVDTGIDFTHGDISGNIWSNADEVAGNGIDDDHNGYVDDYRGWNFVSNNNNPTDDHGHGTHVSGTIAAIGDNNIGVIGVAWRAKVMPVKGLDSTGHGYDSWLASAIEYAADNGADVISNSWGGYGASQTISDAVSYAYNLGAVVVAAAGNDSADALKYSPAGLVDVITVAASTPTDTLAYFSNYGDKIDVAAPGSDILSLQAAGTAMGTRVSTGYTRASGTSMAAPHVSGVAALILSQHPEYSNEQIRQVIRSSATDIGSAGFDTSFGYGRLNASAALDVIGPLEAKIYTPIDGSGAKGSVTITGVARGTSFAQYTLDYGVGTNPTSWTTFQNSNAPVSGVLGVFDTTTLSNGTYVIRLTATNASGQSFVDRIQLIVGSVAIASPVPPKAPTSATTFKPGTQIAITGSAIGPAFQSFRVEWARGVDPSSGYQSTGITLTGGGLAPIGNGTLARWDTTGITIADYYTIRLVVTGSSVTDVRTMVYLQPDLMSINWPLWLDMSPGWGGMVPAANAAGGMRLLTTSSAALPGALFTISSDGSTVQKTSLPAPGYGSAHQPSAADLDGNGGDEAIVADYGVVRVYNEDGTTYSFVPSNSVYFGNAQLTVEDLDGDSQLETIAFGTDFTGNAGYVFAWRPNGQLLNSNFPIRVNDLNDVRSYLNHVRMVVGDVDGDGKKEIVIEEGLSSSTFTLRLFGNDGLAKTWQVPTLTGLPLSMVAADLDHNGKLETIVASNSGTQVALHVFQPDGSERAGWPVVLPNVSQSTLTYPAVGDLDRDGSDEVVLAHAAELDVLRADGTVFPGAWPLKTLGTNGTFGAVTIGDVDGDGIPEIVTPLTKVSYNYDPMFPYGASGYYDQSLLVIRSNGTTERSWQLTGMNGYDSYISAVPIIGDFNADGVTEIGAAFTLSGPDISPGVVELFDTGAPFNPAVNDWPMQFQNSRNTAVLVHNPHVPPTAAGQSVMVTVNTATSITLMATGSPTDWSYSQPSHGTVTGTAPNVTYTPESDYIGADSFTFTASNAYGTSNTARVNITVQLPSAPVANNQSVSVPFNTARAIILTATNNPTSWTYNQPLHGTVSGTGPTVTYTPVSGYSGADSFTFNASNASGTSNTATVTINVQLPPPPVASSQSVSAVYRNPTAITLTATNNPTSWTVTSGPSLGSLSGTAPNLTYTAIKSPHGPDSFTFTASNAGGTSNVATVSITIVRPPVASAQTVVMPINTPTAINLSASNSPTSWSYTQPSHGTVTGTAPTMTYTPVTDYVGTDSFTFTASNIAGSSTATVSISVGVAPVADNQSVSMPNSTPVAITLTASNNPTNWSYSQPSHGMVTGAAPNVTYSPTAGYIGTDSFTFTASNINGSSTATVSIAVKVPLAISQTIAVPINTTLGFVFSATNNPTSWNYTQPSHGKVTGTPPGYMNYTPDAGYTGTDSFTFTATNAAGTSNTATVTFTVSLWTPVAYNQTIAVVTNTPREFRLDAVYSPDRWSYTQPLHGTVTGTGPYVTYTSAAGYTGPDSFTFNASNASGTSNTATVSITVTATSTAPVAYTQFISTSFNLPCVVTLRATNNPTSFSWSSPSHGTLTTVAGGADQLLYTPASGFVGTDSFTYAGSNAAGYGNWATVTITVDPQGNPPVADNQTVTTTSGTALRITLTASNNPTSWSHTQPSHGTVTGIAPNVTYTPAIGYVGPDSFTFSAGNGVIGNTATVNITVLPLPLPVVSNQSASTRTNTPVAITLAASNNPTSWNYSQPSHGTVTGTGPNVTYTPANGYVGLDSFTFTASNPAGTSNTATVTIAVNLPPTADSVTPTGGSGNATFAFKVSAPAGYSNLSFVQGIINGSAAYPGGCAFMYLPGISRIYLMDDGGVTWVGSAVAGTSTVLSNSQCAIDVSGVSASGTGDQLTLTVPISFQGTFAGQKSVYAYAATSSGNSGWQKLGTWTPNVPVVVPVATAPTVDSVNPAAARGASQNFTFQFSSVNGYAYIDWVQGIVNSSSTYAAGCTFFFVRSGNQLYLMNDAGDKWQGPVTPGVAGTVSNTQCTIDSGKSSVLGTGNTLSLNLAITASPSVMGTQNIYGYVKDLGGLNSGWVQKGTWLPNPVATAPTVDSVSPAEARGAAQNFSFQFSSVNGYAYIDWVQGIVNSSPTYAAGCTFFFARPGNQLYLMNDAGDKWQGPVTPGVAGTVSNTQCTIDSGKSSVLGTGNTLSLNLAISRGPSVTGTQNIYGYVKDLGGLNSGWVQKGTWLPDAPVVDTPPRVVSATSTPGIMSFTFASDNGGSYINSVQAMVGPVYSYANSCTVYYQRSSKRLYLSNDAGTGWLGPVYLGQYTSVGNSQCTVYGGNSSEAITGNNLTLNVAATYATGFMGVRNAWGYVVDNVGAKSSWVNLGPFTVQ